MKKDIYEKQLEDYNDVFADIFNALLFEGEEEFLDTMSVLLSDARFRKIKEQITDKQKEEMNMCSMLDEIENHGIEIGLVRGRSEGLEHGLARGIEALIKENMDEGAEITHILQKLQTYFNLDPETAERYYRNFSKNVSSSNGM